MKRGEQSWTGRLAIEFCKFKNFNADRICGNDRDIGWQQAGLWPAVQADNACNPLECVDPGKPGGNL